MKLYARINPDTGETEEGNLQKVLASSREYSLPSNPTDEQVAVLEWYPVAVDEKPKVAPWQVARRSEIVWNGLQPSCGWTVVDVIDPETLVREEGSRRAQAAVGVYSNEERQTWNTQEAEARAVASRVEGDPYPATPILGALAEARGITVDEMAERVLALSIRYKQGVGHILARQSAILAMNPIPADFRDDKYWT